MAAAHGVRRSFIFSGGADMLGPGTTRSGASAAAGAEGLVHAIREAIDYPGRAS
jgi:hypothetical protein